jgi:hypothetical protein
MIFRISGFGFAVLRSAMLHRPDRRAWLHLA